MTRLANVQESDVVWASLMREGAEAKAGFGCKQEPQMHGIKQGSTSNASWVQSVPGHVETQSVTTQITMTSVRPLILQFLMAPRQASGKRLCSGLPIVTAGGAALHLVNFCLE